MSRIGPEFLCNCHVTNYTALFSNQLIFNLFLCYAYVHNRVF